LLSTKRIRYFDEPLEKAYCDLIFLLDRGYSKSSALNFVGNHYTLNIQQRNILIRAAISLDDVNIIKNHMIQDSTFIRTKDIYIDTYNQLITFYSIMNNDPLIFCRDGVYRDIFSSLHNEKDFQINRNFLSQYLEILKKLQPKKVFFFLDAQRSHSGDHAYLLSEGLSEFNITGECIVDKAVDWHLKRQTQALIFTHDSAILITANYCFDFFLWGIVSGIFTKLSLKNILDFEMILC
jgi:hypothetical protein